MTRACAALLCLIAMTSSGLAQDRPFESVLVASEADLVAPPRVAAGWEQGSERLFLALPVASGIDVVAHSVSDPLPSLGSRPTSVHAVRRTDLMAGGRRGARIAVAAPVGSGVGGFQPTIVVLAAITIRKGGSGGDLLSWRSTDGGRTWGRESRISDVPGCAAEGLFDLTALQDGRFAVVWLDMREKGTRLVADFSIDGQTWGEDVVAAASPDGSICECCPTAIAPGAVGGAVVAFRNSVKGDRDVWTTSVGRSSTKFAAPAKSGRGAWKLAACPMAGPSVGVMGTEPVAAWRRENEVFVAVGGAKEVRVGEGTEPCLVSAPGAVHVFWIAGDSLMHASPIPPAGPAPQVVAKNASFPSAAGLSSGRTVVTWLDTTSRRTRLAFVP